jgi:uncharacterized protein YciI
LANRITSGVRELEAHGSRPGNSELTLEIGEAYSQVVPEQIFAVIRTRGPRWDAARRMEDQDEWRAHAAFMNALAKEGFVVLVGPLEGTPDVLLVARAGTSDEVAARLAEDPWAHMDLLRVARISPWTLRIGSLP